MILTIFECYEGNEISFQTLFLLVFRLQLFSNEAKHVGAFKYDTAKREKAVCYI